MSDGAGIDHDGLQGLIWRACLHAGHPVSVPASHVAAEAALGGFAGGIARAELERFAPPPRPPLMVELHERTIWAHWHNRGLLATSLRRYADDLDARAHAEAVAATEDRHAA